MSEDTQPNWIIDTTDADFESDVVNASQEQLVLVDFWASWCQPCRLLAPNLEQAVSRFNGEVRLVKVNTEIAPETAQSFQIESIPTVYAFLNGNPIDYFQGVIEAEEISRWIEQLQIHREIMAADLLTDTDPANAVAAWKNLLLNDNENTVLQIGLARALSLSGESEKATSVIAKLEERGFLEPEAEKVKAMITLTSG
ncbi:MAG: thioredoxin fold domain-containing protein, partial [Planctomycetaceae bacterium]|nr:thioredoxin fold domain-containing protein [Planctomycetaceae bacterium]